ncbi:MULTISPECIES: TetR/AcrR family transcriptional regulator [unclassified Streptomyces]|uniref:TetR/AcrR family transcriptional regulator n=1 Tax=unclassified Streptomyces TaxID=2593676 RepID=UPI002552AB94|nr:MULTISPECIES: TetR/AcrR family transcriptional regulator [unclassified Streptomyces]WRZ69886.1 TetR/AcrR family transcriptional regulator [Streptomyces sp. NBC_01257]WSU63744.1 TetR/AcrR family transcriptional regulator [Streptomyces sp. NBC_01104]
MEAVLTAAVALLDEAGAPALTLRALAARLGTGVGSIYWYVSGKDELLDRAIDHVLGGVLTAVEGQKDSGDPIDDLRMMAVTLFDAVVDRPWLGAQFMRNIDVEGNTLRIYEELGQKTAGLGLTPRQRFHAVSAVVGVVVANAGDMGQDPPQEVVEGLVGREEYLGRYAATWRTLDPGKYPFLHDIVDEFDGHDDKEQFLAGLDLTLAGLRLQAEAGRRLRAGN